MHEPIKRLITGVTPPILLDLAKASLRRRRVQAPVPMTGSEKGADWYDASMGDDRRLHYSRSEYYFLWAVIADRIVRSGGRSVFEIACGAGQFACLLRDKGIREYRGFDFSPKRVAQAQQACPEFSFSVQDAFKTDLFDSWNYDTVVCTEFLEHVHGDLDVLARIKPGVDFYGTVPNFPYTSHVRHFDTKEDVLKRYGGYFHDLRVDLFFADDRGKTFYLMNGKIEVAGGGRAQQPGA